MLAVFLRNGEPAVITSKVTVGEYRIEGRRRAYGSELWTKSGHWREDRSEHPLDIVILKNPDGQLFKVTGDIQIQ